MSNYRPILLSLLIATLISIDSYRYSYLHSSMSTLLCRTLISTQAVQRCVTQCTGWNLQQRKLLQRVAAARNRPDIRYFAEINDFGSDLSTGNSPEDTNLGSPDIVCLWKRMSCNYPTRVKTYTSVVEKSYLLRARMS